MALRWTKAMQAGVLGTVLGLAITACASGAGGSSAGPRRNSDVISLEEIQASQASNAYDLVRQLRPQFLRQMGGINDPVIVYVDGVRHGDASALQSIESAAVAEIRYVNSRDATTLYGTGHRSGAIQVSLRR